MTGSWRFLEYYAFWNKVASEVWMIDRFLEDFGLFELGLKPAYYPRRIPRRAFSHMSKENQRMLTYLVPWVLVMTYKILEVVHESTRTKRPKTFRQYPDLLEVCESLRERLRKARNKVVHVGKYGAYAFYHVEQGKKVFDDNYLIVRDERNRRVVKISLYDVSFAGVFAAYLARAVRKKRVRGSDLQLVYDQVEALRFGLWIDKQLFTRFQKSCAALKGSRK
jgi:hypothetical protein